MDCLRAQSFSLGREKVPEVDGGDGYTQRECIKAVELECVYVRYVYSATIMKEEVPSSRT